MANETTNTPQTPVEVAPVPTPKVFQGKPVKIDTISEPVPVERIGVNPVVKDKWSNVVLPKFMMVERVDEPYGGNRLVTYFDYKRGVTESKYVPSILELKLLTGLQGQAVTKRYQEHLVKNFEHKLLGPLHKTIGADPEIFVENGNGEIIPAFKFLKANGAKDVDKYSDH